MTIGDASNLLSAYGGASSILLSLSIAGAYGAGAASTIAGGAIILPAGLAFVGGLEIGGAINAQFGGAMADFTFRLLYGGGDPPPLLSGRKTAQRR